MKVMNIYAQVMKEICGWMKARKVTTGELATMLKIEPEKMLEILSGNQNLTLKEVEDIADALEVYLVILGCDSRNLPHKDNKEITL